METPLNTERLAHLLELQDGLRAERDDCAKRRVEIMRKADEAGRADLNATEDAAFCALTANIAEVDERLGTNDAQIRTLAELNSLDVAEDQEDEVASKLAAAAEIYIGWRNSSKARGPQTDAPTPRRNLTLAEARAVEKLDQA